MMCRWMNISPAELKRMDYHTRVKYQMTYMTIMAEKPELLMGM